MRTPTCRRWHLSIALGIALASGAAVVAQEDVLHVTVVVDRDTVRIGDKVVASVSVTGPADVADVRLRLDRQLGDFEVLDVRPALRTNAPGRFRWEVDLIAFDDGQRSVGALGVEGIRRGGQPVTGRAAGIPVRVTALAVTATDGLAPMTAPLAPEPRRSRATGNPALALLAALFVAAALWTVVRWRARARTRPRWRDLHAALGRLAAQAGRDAAASRGQWDTAATLVRQGVSWLAGQPVDALSSSEMTALAGRRDGAIVAPLAALLAALDEGRFGGPHADATRLAEVARHAAGVMRSCETASRRPETRPR